MFTSEEEAKKILLSEGHRLKSIADKVWQQYLGSYTPKKYVRTHRSENGIKIGGVKSLGKDLWGIEVTFENSLMYHNSVIGKGKKNTNVNQQVKINPQGHSIMLISSGWKAKKLEKKIGVKEHFTRYKGFNYLGKVVKEFNSGKHKGISLEVQWSGAYLK
jgi:hypothetical protein